MKLASIAEVQPILCKDSANIAKYEEESDNFFRKDIESPTPGGCVKSQLYGLNATNVGG